MPAPQFVYHELEAAFASGYRGLRDWQQESVQNRAKVIAHHIHKKLRDGYEAEAAMNKGGDKNKSNSAKDGGHGFRSLLSTLGL